MKIDYDIYIKLIADISKSGQFYKHKIKNIHLKKLTTLCYIGTTKFNDNPDNVVFKL